MADEGSMLLHCTNPESYPTVYAVQFMLARLPHLLVGQIQNFRLYHLLAAFLSSLFLSYATCSYVQFQSPLLKGKISISKFAAMFCVCLLGNLLEFTTVEFPLGYNTCATLFVSLSFGFILLSIASKRGARIALLLAAGAAAALCVFARPPAAIFWFALATFLIVIHSKRALPDLGLFLVGAAGGLSVFFQCFEPFDAWLRSTVSTGGLEALRGSHSLTRLFSTTVSSLPKHIYEVCAVIALLGICAFSKRMTRSTLRVVLIAAGAAGVLCIVALSIKSADSGLTLHSSVLYLPWVILLLFITYVARTEEGFGKWLQDRENIRIKITILILAVLPLAISFSTNCPLLWHCLGHSGSSFIAILLICLLLGEVCGKQRLWSVMSLCVTLVAGLQITFEYVLKGHQRRSLVAQTKPVTGLPNMENMLVENGQKEFLEGANSMLRANGFQTGDFVLSLYDCPGLVWALRARSPGYAWFADDAGTENLNQQVIESRLPQFSSEPFILVSTKSGAALPAPSIITGLNHAHVRFPDSYKLAGVLRRPSGAHADYFRPVYVYVPVRSQP